MNTDILVLAEHFKGETTEITFEMLGVARTLAAALHCQVAAAVIGADTARLAARLGAADLVLAVEQAGAAMMSSESTVPLLQQLLARRPARLVLVAGTNICMGIGAKLALRLQLPYVNFCKAVNATEGALTFTSLLFGGKILADLRLPDNRGIVSLYPGSFPPDAGQSERAPVVEKIDLPAEAGRVVFKQLIEPDATDVDITKQEVLVAVGRGIETQDNLSLAEDLAAVLQGAVCASRPVIDQGWLPLTRQVGKSGMTVKPKCYLAAGISGAPEHVEGMKNSALTIAINKDAAAPIFDVAHYGVCGDLLEILPELTAAIKARKGA